MNGISLPDGRNFAWHASGSGPPLVLIHGWGNSSAIFAGLMALLPGYHCLAPDLPGYGASTPAAKIDLDTLVDDCILWLDALALDAVTLLGWSLGGIIAQRLAARFPQRVDRLILVATTPRFVTTADWPHGLADTAVRALARDFKRAPAATLENFWHRQFQGEGSTPSPIVPQLETATALGGLELLRQVDLRAESSNITMPTLVVHGSDDVIIPVGAGHFLATSLPQARLLEVDGIGHVPFSRAANQVSAVIRAFLS